MKNLLTWANGSFLIFFLFEKRVKGSITQQTPCIYRGNLFHDFNLKAFLAFCFLRSNCLEMEKNKKRFVVVGSTVKFIYIYIYISTHTSVLASYRV